MKRIALAIAAAAALFAAAGAQAQDEGETRSQAGARGYVGASAGVGHMDTTFPCDGARRCSDSSGGRKLYAGFMVSEYLAVEAVYAKFGRLSYAHEDHSLHLTGTSVALHAVWRTDLSYSFTGTVRVGVASNTTKVKGSIFGFSGSDAETHLTPSGGLALGYRIMTGLSVEAGIDLTDFEYANIASDGRLFSLGLRYAF